LTALIVSVVEQLDARDRDAALDRLDHRVDRARHRRKRADRGRHASGIAYSRSVSSVMMPSVPSAPTNRRVRS
jgi:hypothetical protein